MDLHEDRIIRFLDACERAGIKNPAAFLASKRHMVFDWLKGCFPFCILPTDIDGLVHLNGHYLLLEFKDQCRIRDGAIPKGQAMCLNGLHNTRLFTVFLIGLDPNDQPSCMEIIHETGKRISVLKATRETIQENCRKWSEYVQPDCFAKAVNQ